MNTRGRAEREKAVVWWTGGGTSTRCADREGFAAGTGAGGGEAGGYMVGTEKSVGLTDASHIAKQGSTGRPPRPTTLSRLHDLTRPRTTFAFCSSSVALNKNSKSIQNYLLFFRSICHFTPLKVMISLDLLIPSLNLMPVCFVQSLFLLYLSHFDSV